MEKLKLNIQLFSVSQDDSSVVETDEVYFEFEDLPSMETALDCENVNEMQKRIKRQVESNKQDISDLNIIIEDLKPKPEYTESDNAPYSCNYINENMRNTYNLVTDGPAVKTGRKIDGKDEYIKRIVCSPLGGQGETKRFPTGIDPTKSVITDIKVIGKSVMLNWFPFPNNDTGSCKIDLQSTGDLQITMYTGNWYGETAYADISYTEAEEES